MKNIKDVQPEVKAPSDIPALPAVVEEKLKKWFADIPADRISALVRFHIELTNFNKTLALIPPPTVKNAESVHVADSVLASRMMVSKLVGDHAVYDFGNGNGCPGLVFASLNPTRAVVIVEKDPKKIEFCKHVAGIMLLKNVTYQQKGFEELAAASVYNVISRGFGPLQKAMMVARKPVATGGRYFQMKTDTWANELASVPSQLFSFWTPSLIGQYKIPDSSTMVALVLTEKTAA